MARVVPSAPTRYYHDTSVCIPKNSMQILKMYRLTYLTETHARHPLFVSHGLCSSKEPVLTVTGMQRHDTNDLDRSTKSIRFSIENSRFFRGLLKAIGVFSVSMVMADGVLTPAQSVLGAVQGLSVVKSDMEKSTIIGVTCAILILLFAIQPLGISRLTMVFSPIVMVWLFMNAGFGVYNLSRYKRPLPLMTFAEIPDTITKS